MNSASIPDFKWDIKRLLAYYLKEVERASLDIRTKQEVTLQTVRNENPDIVILASGGEAIMPDVPGLEKKSVVTAIDALVRWDELNIGKSVMVLGAGLVGYEAAWFAAQKGRDVIMISRRSEENVVKLKEHGTNLALLIKGVRDAGVRVLGGRELKALENGSVILSKNGSVESHKIDNLIISRGYAPRNGLANQIEGAGLPCTVYKIGDCAQVRNFFDAINEGAHVLRKHDRSAGLPEYH